MNYTFDRHIAGTFNDVVERTIAALEKEGFGVLTDIDVSATMKAKLGVEFRPYRILGACNPPLSHQALQAEDKIGAMLPCNVIVQEKANGIEVSAVDPLVGMERIGNPELSGIASEVAGKLKKVLESI
ncbi:MAG: DUF302 domain-containing protein [Aestuariivirga sp.]|nr:DUF302 domain-containing protein [Aestuariivirga sp.]